MEKRMKRTEKGSPKAEEKNKMKNYRKIKGGITNGKK